MAKQRYIDTRFWHDTFIRESLNPLDRYLFLYFLTNDKTNICGVYELPISIIASETGIEKEMVKKMLPRLKGKVDYYDGWVVVRNFQKYQNTSNPKIKTGIDNELSKIPEKIMIKIGYLYPTNTQSYLNRDLNSNSNSNIDIKIFAPGANGKDVNDLISYFEPINPTFSDLFKRKNQREAIIWLVDKYGVEKTGNMIKSLPKIIGMPYAPRITTPLQLKEKLGQLIAFMKQENGRADSKKQKIFR